MVKGVGGGCGKHPKIDVGGEQGLDEALSNGLGKDGTSQGMDVDAD